LSLDELVFYCINVLKNDLTYIVISCIPIKRNKLLAILQHEFFNVDSNVYIETKRLKTMVSCICYKTLLSCSLLFVVGIQFSMNMVLIFLKMVEGVYPHGMALQFHLSCFEISKHIGETCLCFVCC